ncbi:hypothetical protein D3C72_1552900 [compost metagenome]
MDPGEPAPRCLARHPARHPGPVGAPACTQPVPPGPARCRHCQGPGRPFCAGAGQRRRHERQLDRVAGAGGPPARGRAHGVRKRAAQPWHLARSGLPTGTRPPGRIGGRPLLGTDPDGRQQRGRAGGVSARRHGARAGLCALWCHRAAADPQPPAVAPAARQPPVRSRSPCRSAAAAGSAERAAPVRQWRADVPAVRRTRTQHGPAGGAENTLHPHRCRQLELRHGRAHGRRLALEGSPEHCWRRPARRLAL